MPEVNAVNKGIDQMRRFWAWFLSLGVAFIIIGLIGFVYGLTATVTTLSLFGWLLLIGGLLELIPSFLTGTWSGSSFYFLDAVFRVVVGFLFLSYPTMQPVSLKATLATFLIVIGLSRAIGAGMAKFAHYGWAISSGILTTLLGFIAIGVLSLWYVGFAIGADFIFAGVAMIGFGTGLHSTPRQTAYRPA
jgi:uncharacterized membrane protein HdeD (DUF308 family)